MSLIRDSFELPGPQPELGVGLQLTKTSVVKDAAARWTRGWQGQGTTPGHDLSRSLRKTLRKEAIPSDALK